MALTELDRAIAIVGGKTAMARKLGVTTPSVHQWCDGSRPIPADRVIKIAAATDWQVTPHSMRPDIYPNLTDGLPHGRTATQPDPSEKFREDTKPNKDAA